MENVEIFYCNETEFMVSITVNMTDATFINSLRQITEQSLDILCIYATILFIISLIGNTTFIVTVWRSYQLHNTAYYYVSSLAMVDILVAMVYMIQCLSQRFMTLAEFLETLTCKMLGIFSTYLVVIEFSTIGLVTLERYFMICYPYTHQEKLMLRFPGFFIAGLWSLGFIIYISPVFVNPGFVYNGCIQRCLPYWIPGSISLLEIVPLGIFMHILLLCYIRIGIAVYRANKHIKATMVTPQPLSPSQETQIDEPQTDGYNMNTIDGNSAKITNNADKGPQSQAKQDNKKIRKSGSKGIKVIVLITVIYFILWFVPIFSVVVARNFALAIFGDAFYFLSTATVLPIYGIFDTRFKMCLRKTFGCNKGHISTP
ncbi:unnamed protein product [Owenia fusiformis]|uniref:G-protein coupled receptors family 1 profile domain-containing protein n=1 Tax=Owenia fusiformis TaxID=6347 RepID=A0A8S4NT82_OWEFU|nr:unnamed protein product [Owenia fusiformis]